MGIFRGVRGVKREKMQEKKSNCKLFWFCTKKVIAEVYSSGIKSTLWSKKMSGATADSFFIVLEV